MNWKNLEEYRCPKCSSKMTFKLGGKRMTIKKGKPGAMSFVLKRDSYFCFGECDFMIRCDKVAEITKKRAVTDLPMKLYAPMPGKKVSLLF